MPIHECTLPDGGKGYQWGGRGTCYRSRSDAEKQAAAAYANGYRGKSIAGLLRSLYVQVALDPESERFIHRAQKYLCLRDFEPKYSPHCTVMYSRDVGLYDSVVSAILATETEFMGRCKKVVGWPGRDRKGYIVLTLESKGLAHLHNRLRQMGAIHSFPKYEPHVTLAVGTWPEIHAERILEFNNMLVEDPVYFLFDTPTFDEISD